MLRGMPTDAKYYAKRNAPPPKPRGSRVTIPRHCHPAARIVFEAMREQRVTYDELEARSGVLRSTAKAWRSKNAPGMTGLEAVLGALHHRLVAVPNVEAMPPELRADLEPLAAKHGADLQHLVGWLVETCALNEALTADGAARVEAARRRATDAAAGRDRTFRSRRLAKREAAATALQ